MAENTWRPLFDLGVNAYYGSNPDLGRRACEQLLATSAAPPEVEEQLRRNLSFYVRPLSDLLTRVRMTNLEIPVEASWSIFNPSIAASGDGFLIIIRSSNYVMDERMSYTIFDPVGLIRTNNYLAMLDADLAVRAVAKIDDSGARPDPIIYGVLGLEDCRLFFADGSWRVSATMRERNREGICQVLMARLDGARLVDPWLLNNPDTFIHEKNWMPIADGGSPRWVYSCYPTRVVAPQPGAPESHRPEIEWPASPLLRGARGGSQVVPIEGGWLAVIHESVDFNDGGRVYLHRFVQFAPDFHIVGVSRQFYFKLHGVEFCAGMAIVGDRVVLSTGVFDRECVLTELSLAEIRTLIQPFDAMSDDPELRALLHESAQLASDLLVNGTTPVASAVDQLASPPESATTGVTPVPMTAPDLDATPDAPPPRIVAVTLFGNNRDLIGPALESALDLVDAFVMVDTGSTDGSLDLARDIVGDRLIVFSFPWIEDFAAARNFSLAAATATGAEWAMILDTDERMAFDRETLETGLAASSAAVLTVDHAGGTYGKERLYRLPVKGEFRGATHEYWDHAGQEQGVLEGATFDETGKSPAQYREKVERDIRILSRVTKENPYDPRWFYYLGDALQGQERHHEAIAAFEACARLRGWDEEGAWACYRAARSWLALANPDAAIASCAAGMAIHAGLAELPWLAGYASWQAGRAHQTVWWALAAMALGVHAGAGERVPRIGFRYPPALYEGPFDLLRFALPAIGDEEGGEEAERMYEAARAARLERFGDE